jgi:hypothetical protein
MEGLYDQRFSARGTTTKPQASKMMQTRTCPKCGAKLYTREVFDEAYCTRNEFFEMYCIHGHCFLFSVKDLKGVNK